ncbi:hypothetical protein AGMMS49579_20940 [Spirochaetia bacterium]|nr:hypothetical protein AGMMS49579_20940 [Spirochaetia bacterium]
MPVSSVSRFYKAQYDLAEKTVLLTFGLLSPNKGIEQVIRALPEIIKVKPETVYIVLGVTHPGLIRHEGEAYGFHCSNLQRNSTWKNTSSSATVLSAPMNSRNSS